MRKAITMSLASAFFLSVGGRVATAADRAGIGFEYGMGPTIILGGEFDMTMNQSGAFTWTVSDNFAVSIFTNTASVRGSHEYTDNTGANSVTRKVVLNGHSDTRGLAIWASLPMLSFLKVGFELGDVELNETNRDHSASDGSATTGADFAENGDTLTSSAMLEGIAGKLTFIRGDSKTISADLSVVGALRFVQLEDDIQIYGTQEVDSTTLPLKAIDPISGFNNLDIKLVATIGF